tara:strand:+ start:1087 stop:1278 length:192 start_codon:yes stop_codon:yes gene_type:complete
MIKIGKYSFDSREQAQTKIDALGTVTDEDGTIDHPYGWKSKSVNIVGDGVHAFFGLNYDSLKF